MTTVRRIPTKNQRKLNLPTEGYKNTIFHSLLKLTPVYRYLIFIPVFIFCTFSCQDNKVTNEVAEPETEAAPTPEMTENKTYEKLSYAQASPALDGQEIKYATDNTDMVGYLAFNAEEEGKRPGVLVIHEWWGHNEYARGRAEMLADLGYVALAVDMYGEGKKADHPQDAGKFSSAVFANMDEAKARFEQAMQTLKAHPMVDSEQIAAIGYCFGGSVALTMANAGYDLDAVAAFHSGVTLPIMPDAENPPATKVLVANGAADPFIKPEDVANWSKAMDAVGADYEYVAYPDTKHAYTDPGATAKGETFNLPLVYQEESDADAWMKLQALLDRAFQ